MSSLTKTLVLIRDRGQAEDQLDIKVECLSETGWNSSEEKTASNN